VDKIIEIACHKNKTFQILEWYPVVTKDYGSEGSEPSNSDDCPLKVSCVSGSGGSLCGHYMGHVSYNVVRCSHER